MQIQIPYKFEPRPYQLPFLAAMDRGVKRLVIVWHRRAGKDKTLLNATIKKMLERVGNYYYFFPDYSQARKVIWEGKDKSGMAFLDHFPPELVASRNESNMQIKLINGSIFQLVGTNNYDSIMGTNPAGCVFSEYSLQNPQVWDYIRPILAENGGWAVFNFTPRGKNHGYKILQQAQQSDDSQRWFSQVLTVDDTNAISKVELEAEKAEMPEALYLQEFYCHFLEGAGQFFRNVRGNLYDPRKEMPRITSDMKLGVDLAKYNDYTVITPFSLNDFTVFPQDRFNQIDWITQEGRIHAKYQQYKCGLATIDATGVGDPIVERLQSLNMAIPDDHAFKFTKQSRERLLRHLAILIEKGMLKLPNDEGLLSELESFMLELDINGNVQISVPEGLHDDRVMSLALAVWGYSQPIPETIRKIGVSIANYNDDAPIYPDIGV
jgi:hypothetical protein